MIVTYMQHVRDGGAEVLERVDRAGSGRLFARCPCGNVAHGSTILNVASLYQHMTNGAEWACDDCYARWKRAMIPVVPGDTYLVPEEFTPRFLEILGADLGDVEHHRRHAVKALSRLRCDCEKKGDAATVAEIDQRAGMPLSVSGTTIAADGIQGVQISGIPDYAEVSLDGGPPQVVHDGLVGFTATTPGEYKLRITHENYVPAEVTIHAD